MLFRTDVLETAVSAPFGEIFKALVGECQMLSRVSPLLSDLSNNHVRVALGIRCFCYCLGIAPRAKMLKMSAWLLHPKW